MGTTITNKDLQNIYGMLSNIPINERIISVDEFNSAYNASKDMYKKEYEYLRYKEMWKKVKISFPFHNKI